MTGGRAKEARPPEWCVSSSRSIPMKKWTSPSALLEEEWTRGLEIYDAFVNHGKVNAHVIGMTASAATFLTMGAKHVDMVEGSLMLIHNASNTVFEWGSANKEELDRIIEKYQKMRKDLDTIDKVIGSIYAKKTGKSLEECMNKMTSAAWLSPQDCLDFGLIDEIRKDPEETQNVVNNRKSYLNLNKEYGLPSFPASATLSAKEVQHKRYCKRRCRSSSLFSITNPHKQQTNK